MAAESVGVVRNPSRRATELVCVSSFLVRPLQPKGLTRIVSETLWRRFDHRRPNFERRDFVPDFIHLRGDRRGGRLRSNCLRRPCGARFGRNRRRPSARLLISPRPSPNEIMNAAGRHPHLAFFRENARDVPVSATPPPEFLDEFAVRLQARPRRFLRQRVQYVLQTVVHKPEPTPAGSCFESSPEGDWTKALQTLAVNLTNTGQMPNNTPVARARATLSRRLRDSVSFNNPPRFGSSTVPAPLRLRNPPNPIAQIIRRPAQPDHEQPLDNGSDPSS